MPKGLLAFVLHAHLPYVRHPEYDDFLEERWFFEGLSETYIPLLHVFERLAAEEVPFRVALSISPSLLAMLDDALLAERYDRHLGRLVELAGREMEGNAGNPQVRHLATMYRDLFQGARKTFRACGGKLWKPFLRLHKAGHLELATTAATHGLLPVLSPRPAAVQAQVRTGLDYAESVLGFRPRGLWLPECGWYPGLDAVLAKEGVRWSVVENSGVLNASVPPYGGVHAPLFTPSGVAAFGRDHACAKEVWSAREGFPGDPEYREFYRDIGHDAHLDYIRPYIGPGGVRVDTGLKYHRITGPTEHKDLYRPERARGKAAMHAGEFLRRRTAHVSHLASTMETTPVVVAPFDAELFGHWWFEGPQWLEFVARGAAADRDVVELATPSGYLDRCPVHQVAQPCTSTWGHKGHFESWVNPKTDWIWSRLDACGRRMEALAGKFARKRPAPLVRRALDQCLRELLLAQSSDWPFIINGGTAAQYAERRVRDHVSRFLALAAAVEAGTVDKDLLEALETLDPVFPGADFRSFLPAE